MEFPLFIKCERGRADWIGRNSVSFNFFGNHFPLVNSMLAKWLYGTANGNLKKRKPKIENGMYRRYVFRYITFLASLMQAKIKHQHIHTSPNKVFSCSSIRIMGYVGKGPVSMLSKKNRRLLIKLCQGLQVLVRAHIVTYSQSNFHYWNDVCVHFRILKSFVPGQMESTSNHSDLIQKYKGKRQSTDLGMTFTKVIITLSGNAYSRRIYYFNIQHAWDEGTTWNICRRFNGKLRMTQVYKSKITGSFKN